MLNNINSIVHEQIFSLISWLTCTESVETEVINHMKSLEPS
jgi:hypothetical protein